LRKLKLKYIFAQYLFFMKTCYLDFDKTIQELGYPDTDSNFLNENCIEFVEKVKELGYKVVLNTYRSDLKNGSLEQALQSIESYIAFDEIAPNKIVPLKFDLSSDILFIDDEAINIPLKLSSKILGVKVVNFSEIITLLNLKNSEIQIGNQIWANKNWNTKTFNNSEPILIAKSKRDWYHAINEEKPALCISSDYPDEVLYNWFAINDKRGLIPQGYKIPTTSDVNTLIEYLGGPKYAGVKLKATDETDWEECAYLEPDERDRKNQFGNCSGFNSVPVGLRRLDGWYRGRIFSSNFWVMNEDSPDKPNVLRLIEGVEAAILDTAEQFENVSDFPITQYGFSIRLIKNN
jgi:uncharacterized protein (TIGR02145 family)